GAVLRFGRRDHGAGRAKDVRGSVAGLSLVLAGGPCIAAALVVAFQLTVPYVTNRHVIRLEVAVAMAAALAALAIAVPLTFVLARAIEAGLARLARRAGFVSSVCAPLAAL